MSVEQDRDILTVRDLVTDIQFPSKGLYYGGKLPDGKAKIRAWRTGEIKLIASARRGGADALESALARVVDNCLVLPEGMKPGELTYTDGFYAMVMQRVLTYEPTYTIELKCDACGFKDSKVKLNLVEDLNVRWAKEGAQEPLIFHLPHQDVDVAVRHLRRSDAAKVNKYSENKLQQTPEFGDPALSYRLAIQIETIDGMKVDLGQKVAFVDGLIAKDFVFLHNAIEDSASGLDPNFTRNCRKCGEEIEELMPLTLDFFRPRNT